MNKIAFLNTITTFLQKNFKTNLSVFIISSIIIFILSSFLFVSFSIKEDILHSINKKSDFILQKIRSGVRVDIDNHYIKKIEDISGIENIKGRVYGKYLLKTDKKYINIIGLDLFDDTNELKLLDSDLKRFLQKDQMIISSSFKDYLKSKYFSNYYDFFTPNGDKKRVYFFKHKDRYNLPNLGASYAIMSEELAREILGINGDKFSDISISVKNPNERDTILSKLRSLFFDTKVIDKRDILRAYERFFEYKSSIFLILFIVTLVTYILILYFRYSLSSSDEKRDIAILRMLGWSVNDVIKLKLYESLYIALLSFIVGIVLSYIYIFYFNAPILRDIFLGSNIKNSYQFHPNIDLSLIFSIFIIYLTTFIASIIIPVWKIATSDLKEAIK